MRLSVINGEVVRMMSEMFVSVSIMGVCCKQNNSSTLFYTVFVAFLTLSMKSTCVRKSPVRGCVFRLGTQGYSPRSSETWPVRAQPGTSTWK